MAGNIITPQQIEKATYRITCGDQYGTAFFISNNQLITARHVVTAAVDSGADIILHYRENEGEAFQAIICRAIYPEANDLDVALLEIKDRQASDHLPLFNTPIRYDNSWETFGFPFEQQNSGNRYVGTVRKTNKEHPYDIELTADPIDNTVDYGGLSGSPLVIENRVTGVVTWNILDGFGAISIEKIAGFLESNQITFETFRKANDLPDNFQDDLQSAILNKATVTKMDEKLIAGGKYYLLHGSPGSGKTLLAATYEFEKQDYEIAGRYFIRLPNDNRPTSFRTSREAFLEWMEDLVSQKISGSVSPKKLASVGERIKDLQEFITGLNDYYRERNRIGFIILDGLDDLNISPTGLAEFLGMLPESLPTNLSFVLSIIRKDSLPASIQSKISPAEEILVTPLEIDQCAYYLQQSRPEEAPAISYELLHEIAEKSEGHPLYLRYLSETLKTMPPEDVPAWIGQLPTIGSDITKYYEQLWLTDFSADTEKFWIAFTISQLRQPLATDDLLKTLPDASRLAFFNKFPAIRHLFKVTGKTGIYHNSFSLFIENKAPGLLQEAHDLIRAFCTSNPGEEYCITNIIFHILRSSDPLPAVAACNQVWADECASISVEPELVLNDIQKVELFCIDQGLFTDLIRIKFLLQRVRFRYNNLLAQNASAIAEVLLLIGKPADALKYLVRSNALIVSDADALKFLRRFYEMGGISEGDALLRAIQRRYQAIFEHDKEKGVFRFRTYNLMANSITISAFKNAKSSFERITGLLRHLKKMGEIAETGGEGNGDVEGLRQHISAYHTAYFAYHFKRYTKSAAKMREDMSHVPAEEWTGRLAHNAVYFEQFLEWEKTSEQDAVNRDMVEDIEYAWDNFGYVKQDAVIILSALLEDSRRPDIVKALMEDVYIEKPEDRIRQPNGVDVDIASLFAIVNYHEGLGYRDEKNQYPSQRALFGSVWEEALIDCFKLLGFCFGKAWRLRAEGATEKLPLIMVHIENLVKGLSFSLAERSKWERSYTLPEAIFPYLYFHLTRFYIEFQPDAVPVFLKAIFPNGKHQFGLYTEGYREALTDIANKLSRYDRYRVETFGVVQLLAEHVEMATLNRWERIPALLEIASLYGKLKNIDKAKSIYQKMLDSSMGPTWYKEDQFALVNTALSLPRIDKQSQLFQKLAVQLEFASGELTFQRYVRVAQQAFIRNLVERVNTSAAISYYQYQTIPAAEQIIQNAESSTVDAVYLGDGYVLGARSIIEASGIANLLEKIDADPVLIFALAEVFVINNDIYRYLREFSKIQAACLNKLRSADRDEELLGLQQRLALIINFQEMSRNRRQYLDELETALTAEDKEALAAYSITFSERNPVEPRPDSPENDEAFDNLGFPGMGSHGNYRKLPEYLRLAAEEKNMENHKAAAKHLADAFNLLHEGKSDIWAGSYLGDEVKQLWTELPLVSSQTEIMQHLKLPITDHYTDDWRVADKLIRLFREQVDTAQTAELMEIIHEHIRLMIRNPESIPSFNWTYEYNQADASNDRQLENLLIWLLNHPYQSVKTRVIDAIYQLCKLRLEFINQLITHVFSTTHDVSRELCAYMLYHFTLDHKAIILNALLEFPGLKERLLEEKHFMIKYYFLKTTEVLGMENEPFKQLQENIITSFPETVKPAGDIFLDDPYLKLIEDILNSFQAEGMLNGFFCRDFLANIKEFSKPLTMYGQIRAGHYLERSYFDEEEHYRNAVHILRNAFNHAILQRVTRDKIKFAAGILTLPFLDDI